MSLPPLQGPPFPVEKLVENWLRVDARQFGRIPVPSQARTEARQVIVGSVEVELLSLSCGAMWRCPSCLRISRHLYVGEQYGCKSCLGLRDSIRYGPDRKWADLRIANKFRAMIGAEPFPAPLPDVSRNQRKLRIAQRIRIAETRLITRLQSANQALSRFAKAKKQARAAGLASGTNPTKSRKPLKR
jgi:hypothetical protein